MKTVTRALFLLLVAPASSCVVFPTHLADEKNPYGSQSIGFIEPGDTPRIEIESQLGTPHRVYSEGRWWLYHADRRTTAWGFIIWPGAGGEFGGDVRQYNLILEFNEGDIVESLAVVTNKSPCTHDETVCYSSGVLKIIEHGAEVRLESVSYYGLPHEPLGEPILEMRDGRYFRIWGDMPYTGSRQIVHDNGVVQSEMFFRDGLKQGIHTYYYRNGVKEEQLSYQMGVLQGARIGWYENGQKSTEAFYEDDKRHGVTTHWSPNGKVTGRYCYKNGNVVRTDAEEWKSVCRNGR